MHTPSNYQPTKSSGYYHFQIFKQDIVYQKRSSYRNIKRNTSSEDQVKRGAIQAFSKKSKLRLIHQLRNSQHSFKQFITLTYPKWFPKNGAIVKSHLNTFLTRLRQDFPGVHYAWVFEAQTRGAPHFHLIINVELPFVRMKDGHGFYRHSRKWSERWARITDNESSPAHIRHGLRIDPITDVDSSKLAFYLAKYYSKNDQKKFKRDFKDVGRYWGTSRGFTTPVSEGVYRAIDLRWMLKLCFHYANLERTRAGYKRYGFSVDRGCSIWNFTEIFRERLAEQFKERLDNPYNGYEKPPTRMLRK